LVQRPGPDNTAAWTGFVNVIKARQSVSSLGMKLVGIVVITDATKIIRTEQQKI